jgi:iron complex outermembrane receptor protein
MKGFRTFALAGVSFLTFAAPAFAQDSVAKDSDESGIGNEEIVVAARRRDESAQDVPLVVNAVTAETLDKLNIREFKDVAAVVPGLQLGTSQNGIGAQASLRGVAYDVNASGNNGTIEFYLNDAHLSAGILFMSMFDVGQIEVLRGPQGTLRGRASPSGSITVTTRRPNLNEAGGYVNGFGNDRHGWNLNGAINVPLIEDKLAIRLAGVADENRDNQVRSINNPETPHQETQGGRISIRAEPIDILSLNASYTKMIRDVRNFDQVESLSVRDPSAPVSPTLIRASDRLSVLRIPRTFKQDFEIFNWSAQLRLAGQKLDYVGSRNNQHYLSASPNDIGAFFGPSYPAALIGAAQDNDSHARETTHEVRLSNEERLGGMFDYVVGFYYDKLTSPSRLITRTPLFAGIRIPQEVFPNFITPGGIVPAGTALGVSLAQVVETPVARDGGSVEKSFFGNVTAHIGQLEIAGGLRHINFHSTASLLINGAEIIPGRENRTFNTTIYSASATYRFTPDLMVYAATGSSWRPGPATNAVILNTLVNPGPLVSSFYNQDPETSKSYEIGFKSEWFDRRLRLNVTAYHQDFKNYIYSARNIFVAGRDASGTNRTHIAAPLLAVGVPAKVDGIEAELGFKIVERWDISATAAYSRSKIKNGQVPCNDYFPRNGVSDSTYQIPTFAQITAANNGEQVAVCRVNFSAGTTPPFSASVQSEFSQPVGGWGDAYLRGLFSYYGNSKNDPSNLFDDVKSYGILNLFAGLRRADGGWDVGVYAKNVFNVGRSLITTANPQNVSYQQLFCTTRDPRLTAACAPVLPAGVDTLTFGQNATSTYRGVQSYTIPREFGVNFTMRFGSR